MADQNSLFTHADCSIRKSPNTLVIGVYFLLFLLLALSGISSTAQTLRPETVPSSDPTKVQGNEQVSTLELGKPIERALTAGQAHSYQLKLAEGEYARVVVDQRGINLEVILFSPDGVEIVELDRAGVGLEYISALGEPAGTYRLEVRPHQRVAAASLRCKARRIKIRHS